MEKINEVTIIGPGLIGSSLGLSLKRKKIVKKIIGIDVSKKNLNDALKIKSIDESRLFIDSRVSESSLIFICTPVSLIDQIITELVPFIGKNNIVTDTGSVKNIFQNHNIKKFVKYPTLYLDTQ